MHLPGRLREGRTDMLGISLEMRLEVLEERIRPPSLALLARGGGVRFASLDGRSHRRLVHLGAAAGWAGDRPRLLLLVTGADRAKPCLELRIFFARERLLAHYAYL